VPRGPEIDDAVAAALGRRIRLIRERADRPQDEVANEAGIERAHYQLLEYGLSDRKRKSPANPQLGTLLALARVLHVDPAQLIADALREAGVVVEYDARPHEPVDDSTGG
jgi:transcriptional regulator with XRE-family HTH domain